MKRVLSLALALLLMGALLIGAAPVSRAASPSQAVAYLKQFVRENGESIGWGTLVYGKHSSGKTSGTLTETFGFDIWCSESEEGGLEIQQSYFFGVGVDFLLAIGADGKITNAYVSMVSGEADYNINPASVTRTGLLKAATYRGSESHDRLNRLASTLLKEMLEELQLVLKTGGYSIGDLGFTAYQTGHVHSFNRSNVVSATRCGGGEREWYCDGCNGLRIELFPGDGNHTWGEGIVEQQPTCVEEGYRAFYCTVCGGRRTEPIPPTGNHTWSESRISRAPTCAREGLMVYKCGVCGQEKAESIPATGNHNWSKTWVSSPPTCVDQGTRGYQCSVCGQKKYEPIPATGNHDWSKSWTSVAPTCTQKGTMGLQCAVCGEKKYESIPALGHAWTVTEVLTEPTEEGHGTARYTCSVCNETKEADYCASEIFIDAPAPGKWSHPGIDWAVFNHITEGTTHNTFSPNKVCSRSQVVTFLYRAAGQPGHTETENPFTDVKEGAFYYDAVLWALENNVTSGKTATTFAPKNNCSRAEVVTFLWRAAGSPEPAATETSFTDLKETGFYYKAVLWAVENGITTGTTPETFNPSKTCTRAEVVTFLHRASLISTPEPTPEPAPEPTPVEP